MPTYRQSKETQYLLISGRGKVDLCAAKLKTDLPLWEWQVGGPHVPREDAIKKLIYSGNLNRDQILADHFLIMLTAKVFNLRIELPREEEPSQ